MLQWVSFRVLTHHCKKKNFLISWKCCELQHVVGLFYSVWPTIVKMKNSNNKATTNLDMLWLASFKDFRLFYLYNWKSLKKIKKCIFVCFCLLLFLCVFKEGKNVMNFTEHIMGLSDWHALFVTAHKWADNEEFVCFVKWTKTTGHSIWM